ncbi:hypothetical protein ACFQY8_01270 [Alloscardovia venturai]|uniref:Uncharacterized protein n=1 Tax=Alloscardovia venturai TaxID=1769421 RepID=A0ABW2Y5U7_9BIFI
MGNGSRPFATAKVTIELLAFVIISVFSSVWLYSYKAHWLPDTILTLFGSTTWLIPWLLLLACSIWFIVTVRFVGRAFVAVSVTDLLLRLGIFALGIVGFNIPPDIENSAQVINSVLDVVVIVLVVWWIVKPKLSRNK